MRLLLIEDDQAVIANLRRGLRTTYIIDVATTGADGVHEAEVSDYDGIILDLGLPDIAGLTVCRSLRALWCKAPILVLTATMEVGEKVRLLDAGADDYLTKPFMLEELRARLRVLVRRGSGGSRSSVLAVGGLTVDTASRRVEHKGVAVALRRKEFDLLEYLMHHQGSVVTRAMIMDHVWNGGEDLWTNAVDVHIKCLRDKIDRPFGTRLIKTVYGIGYRIDASAPVAAT